jgi:hypothetical protein
LRLQQVLFYGEMGLPLAEIHQVTGAPGFDMAYLKGEITMEKAGIFSGFTPRGGGLLH